MENGEWKMEHNILDRTVTCETLIFNVGLLARHLDHPGDHADGSTHYSNRVLWRQSLSSCCLTSRLDGLVWSRSHRKGIIINSTVM